MGKENVILGLDIGTSSVGWALVDKKKKKIIKTGVRIFEEGVEGDIESGREESRNKGRRDKRQIRRQLWRRKRRKKKLLRILQSNGILPEGGATEVINQIDKEFFEKASRGISGEEKTRIAHNIPYIIRAKALDEKLDLEEFGRALYHIAQRRGFLSIRKGAAPDSEEGVVKESIGKLGKEMQESGARTLGEHFSKIDPEKNRIRERYTSRTMYQEEFEEIWEKQKEYYPEILNDVLKGTVHNAIFKQRPLKSQKHLVGECELEKKYYKKNGTVIEKGYKRAAMARLLCQRFRYLQRLNDTSVIEKSGEIRELTDEEKKTIAEQLEVNDKLTYKKAIKLLGNKEIIEFRSADEKAFIGNRTVAKIKKAIGDKWDSMDGETRDRLVNDLISFTKTDPLKKRLKKAYKLSAEETENLAKTHLDQTYCRHSYKALKKIVPLLEKGISYATAKKEIYGEDAEENKPVETLPAFEKTNATLRNPMVSRSLTEIRKVVNAIVREYGKPDFVRIELAREMKKSAAARKEISKRIKQNEKRREDAKKKILKETGNDNPRRDDITRALLWEECNGQCPYTGRMIPFHSMYGEHSEFDIEHIIPFSRSLDNSFANKTLCDAEFNRRVKKNMTPFEAMGTDEDAWNEVLVRVKKFNGPAARRKLELFQKEEVELDDFAHRQLNDTAYASREAVKYVGLLYGGEIDPEGKRRVQVCTGGLTAFLRNRFDLNSILDDGGMKTREDHRHHAVDALTVCFADAGMVKKLADAAERAAKDRKKLLGKMDPPWEGFLDDAIKSIRDELIVSHRVNRRVRGPLHEETLYSPQRDERGNKSEKGVYVHIRKPLASLSKKEVQNIADEKIGYIVRKKMEEVGEEDPKKAFTNPENLPLVRRGDRFIPVKKVRVRSHLAVKKIAKEKRERFVKTGSNHHMAIYEVKDKKGKIKWVGEVVSMLEAKDRLSKGIPVVNRDSDKEKKFIMSVSSGDIVEVNGEVDKEKIRVRTITTIGKYPRIEGAEIRDARQKKEIMKGKKWRTFLIDPLRKTGANKIEVGTLGEIRRAND